MSSEQDDIIRLLTGDNPTSPDRVASPTSEQYESAPSSPTAPFNARGTLNDNGLMSEDEEVDTDADPRSEVRELAICLNQLLIFIYH